MIRCPPRLNTEEEVVPKPKMMGLLLKGGRMDSEQPKPESVQTEMPKNRQCGPLGLTLWGCPWGFFLLPWLDPGHCLSLEPVAAIAEAGFQSGAESRLWDLLMGWGREMAPWPCA